ENPYEVRKMIGYLPEMVPLYYDMLVYDYLDFVGQSRHLNDLLKKRMKWVIDACRLESVIHRPIGQLSKGFKQRVCLAQALIHDPEILILDEPTSGLDPLQIVGIRNLIKELAHEKTIMVSTHILQEVTSIADRILVINSGRIVAENTFEELELKTHHDNLFYLDVAVDKAAVENILQQIAGIERLEFTPVSSDRRAQVRLHYTGETVPAKLDRIVKEQGWPLNEFRKENLTLEETFIKLMEQADDSRAVENEGGQA
ncbi:ATP-binding cassette domain-containing protein, partial [bacterium]|nr:ATP-binding cassette domain-containing protein [bacterium]